MLPGCLGWERFAEAWKPCDLILTSRLKVRDRAQKLLFERHEEYFPETSVLLLYCPEDTRRQNIMVTISGPSPEGSVIGKFTQGSVTDGKKADKEAGHRPGELDFLVRDTRKSGTLVGAPQKCPLGHILNYYDGSQLQYTHLRASMLAYAHINLLSMLQRFEPEDTVRVATDSIYVRKSALHKLEGVKAYVAPKRCDCGEVACDHLPLVAPAQWRDKDEELYMPVEHAAYLAKPDYIAPRRPSVEVPFELPKRRRGERQNHASDRALPPEKFPCLHPDPSPGQRDAGPGRPGPDLP